MKRKVVVLKNGRCYTTSATEEEVHESYPDQVALIHNNPRSVEALEGSVPDLPLPLKYTLIDEVNANVSEFTAESLESAVQQARSWLVSTGTLWDSVDVYGDKIVCEVNTELRYRVVTSKEYWAQLAGKK